MWQLVTQTTQMGVFVAITAFGVVMLLAGMVFGHDDHDMDHDHDLSHDHDHGDVGHGEPTVSIFSGKVIGTFIMGFGGAGAMATYYNIGPVGSSFTGLGTGVVLGLAMYGFMRLLYGQQASSLVRTEEAVGKSGTILTRIDPGSTGEVEVTIGELRRTYLAQASSRDISFAKGVRVRVASTSGGYVIVEEEGPREVFKAS